MRRLPDAGQKIRAERQVSIFNGAGLDPYVDVETMCSWHEATGGDAGVARPLGKLAGEDLDIVSEPECSGGST